MRLHLPQRFDFSGWSKIGFRVPSFKRNFGRNGNTCGYKYVTKTGSKYISVAHSLDGAHSWNTSQYAIADGRIKSEYNLGVSLFSSENGYKKWRDEQAVITKCENQLRDTRLTYDKACRILKILEET